ncbi:MAG: hypothetical protein DRQ52_07170 [Gammaproteobacteria bacterium]|nr:MAG: hypothetical protein DRQ52_07170 [Gammaproteobacteria bacterium]
MSTQERRQFFRVDDDVRVSYRKLDARSGEQLARAIKAGLPTSFQLRSQMEAIDQNLEAARKELVDLPYSLKQYLSLLDEKIQQLGQVTELLAGNAQTITVCEVSLSGGGVAIPTDEALAIGQMVELCLQLVGLTGAIHALAEVTDCRRDNEGFNVAMEFRYLTDSDREAIIRRAVHRQGELIRAKADA